MLVSKNAIVREIVVSDIRVFYNQIKMEMSGKQTRERNPSTY